MAIYKSILDLVGGTPLVELTQFEKENDLKATVLAKLEYFNPAGSVKDRIAKAIVGRRKVRQVAARRHHY